MNGVPTTRKTPPYDPVVDFTPIGQVGIFGFFAIVNDAVPAQTLTELFDYARANPGKLNYGTGNLTSILTFAQLAKSERLDIVHIPYKGDALATNDFLTGRIQVMIATPGTAMPHVRTGKLRVLAVLLPSRSPLVPNVPTAVEAGLSSLSIVAWGGLFGPAGLPVEVVERLSRELEVVLARPGVRDGLDRLAFEARASSPAALGALVRDQVEVWQNAVQAARVERD